MAVKRCTIVTERYNIDVLAFGPKNQSVDISLIGGPLIISGLKLFEGTATILKPNSTQYHCESFYYYIKSFVDTALNWYEYWPDLSTQTAK